MLRTEVREHEAAAALHQDRGDLATAAMSDAQARTVAGFLIDDPSATSTGRG